MRSHLPPALRGALTGVVLGLNTLFVTVSLVPPALLSRGGAAKAEVARAHAEANADVEKRRAAEDARKPWFDRSVLGAAVASLHAELRSKA